MQTIILQSHVGSDGILHLDVPVNLTDIECKITMVLELIKSISNTR